MGRRVVPAVLGVWLCLMWAGCPNPDPDPDPDPPKNYGDSVRMMTFNVQFLPGSDDDESRAKRIADRVKATEYEIVAFNEVFDEDARDVLVDELKGVFPNYVAYIGDPAVGAEDSGLMLFSRFEFEPLPRDTHRHDPDYIEARNAGANWEEVAFIEYDEDVFPDNWAGKGAAFVRIRNPHTDRVYNVAFTHLQASYPEDEDDQEDWLEPIDARAAQLADLRKVIVESLAPGQLSRDEVFVLGDLNVDGDLADMDLGLAGYDVPNLYEWVKRFNTSGEFFFDTMKDAWAFEQWPDDRGLTNMYHWGPGHAPEQGARLDYFLRNRFDPNVTSNDYCVQHMTLAHNMRDGGPFIESGFGQAGINELSDHIGINIDLNRRAPYCSPLEARVDPPQNLDVGGNITFPGSMQWYRIDAAGTYAFAVSGGADYRVYEPIDLSTPVPQYYEETINFVTLRGKPVEGKKFVLTRPPFFVRVFHPDRTATAGYNLIVHRATCASQEEACVLRANEPEDHALPPTPVNADDISWFELHTERADSGASQQLKFFVDNFTLANAFTLELRKGDGTSVVEADTTTEPDPTAPGFHRLAIEIDDLDPAAAKYYLLVKRNDLAATNFRIGWETNLTVLHGQGAGVPGAVSENLYCVTETDSIGIDEVYLTVTVDGVTKVDDVYIGDYDDGVYRTMEDLVGTIRYVSEVQVTLREEDGAANGDDDFLSTTIGTLPADQTQQLNTTDVLACCDGEYLFRYNRTRSLNK